MRWFRAMTERTDPIAVVAAEAAPRIKSSNYPEPFASRMKGREKRPLGDRTSEDAAIYPEDDIQAVLVDG